MSKKKRGQQPAPTGTPLTGSRLAMAYEIARLGISQLLPDPSIVLSIVEQCKTTERSASAALQKMAKQGAKLTPEDAESLRDTLHFRYEHLYAQAAQTGKLESAAKMLDRRARLAGLFTKEAEKKPIEQTEDEFEGRSTEDLRFFRDNGFWPEEKPVSNVVPIDPLARLRAKASS